jgi:transposase-like protein
MAFRPPCCPLPACPSRSGRSRFTWHHRGTFRRKCDGRAVQRFTCLACRRSFSTQTFRLDYRLKQPRLHLALFDEFVSKVTMRQSARLRGASRKTIAHRLELLGRHGEQFHRHMLATARRRGPLEGTFQLDELETYETDRRLQPVTVPVLIERRTYFVLHTAVAPLPARGGLSPLHRERKRAREEEHGKRRSGSRKVVRESFEVLRHAVDEHALVAVQTDRKKSYVSILRALFGERLWHARTSSKARRAVAARAADVGGGEGAREARPAPVDLDPVAQLRARRDRRGAGHDAGDGRGRVRQAVAKSRHAALARRLSRVSSYPMNGARFR